MERILDRVAKFDERSRTYAAVSATASPLLRSYTWSCDVWNDQGRQGACVGFGWGHELSARPAEYRVDGNYATGIYNEAKTIDEWSGEDYSGTSVLAGAKVVAMRTNAEGVPLIREYRWAFGLSDVIKVLGYRGPIVFGCNWYSDMWDTDSNGFVHVTGQIVGGHCTLLRGVKIIWKDPLAEKTISNLDEGMSYVTARNSWGQSWGLNGDYRISIPDLQRLINEDAESCIPRGRVT